MAQELKVIRDFYDFMLWLVQRTEKFPRAAPMEMPRGVAEGAPPRYEE